MSEDETPKPRRRPSRQQVAGIAVGCAILGGILLLFTILLYVGYTYIQSR